MDEHEYGFMVLNGLDVASSLKRCSKDAPASSATRQSTTEAVWGAYNSPAGVDVTIWHSIPGEDGERRKQHEKRLSSISSTASSSVPSRTPAEFLALEQELRRRLVVSVNGQSTQLLEGFELSHVQATRMERGKELGRHKDKQVYGEIIATVNLVGTSVLTVGTATRTLRAGDAYALFGQARAVKEHGVSFSAHGPDALRFSLTFRFVPCACFDISEQKSSASLPPLQAGCLVEARWGSGREAQFPSVYPAMVLHGSASALRQLTHDTLPSLQPLQQALGRPSVCMRDLPVEHENHVPVLFLYTDLYHEHTPAEDFVMLVPRNQLQPLAAGSALRHFLFHEARVTRCFPPRQMQQSVEQAQAAVQQWSTELTGLVCLRRGLVGQRALLEPGGAPNPSLLRLQELGVAMRKLQEE